MTRTLKRYLFAEIEKLHKRQKAECNHDCSNCNKDKKICDAYVIAYRDKLLFGSESNNTDKDGYRYPHEDSPYGFDYPIQCQQCGKTFQSYSIRRLYCSHNCARKEWKARRKIRAKQRRSKTCLFCKVSFTAKSSKARFCSLKHRVAYFRQLKGNDSPLVSIEPNIESLHQEPEPLQISFGVRPR